MIYSKDQVCKKIKKQLCLTASFLHIDSSGVKPIITMESMVWVKFSESLWPGTGMEPPLRKRYSSAVPKSRSARDGNKRVKQTMYLNRKTWITTGHACSISSILLLKFGRYIAHLWSLLKFHTTSDKRCGTSSHLWPDGWPGTSQGGLDLYGHGHTAETS